MTADRLDTGQGSVVLHRRPHRPSSPLRAWDAADEYALAHLADMPAIDAGTWVVVNDAFGALAVALAHHRPWSWSDSVIAHAALDANLVANGVSLDAVTRRASTADPPPRVDVVVIKVPKSQAMLEDQLRRLRTAMQPATVVVGAGMTRHVHSSTVDAFERIVGPTTTTPARRRARLLLATVGPDGEPSSSSQATSFRVEAAVVRSAAADADDLLVWNLPGVFSARRLDIGTRFLLDHVPVIDGSVRLVDLGCGNGAVGTVLALRNPHASVVFTDESHAAVASAERTFRGACGDRHAEFVCAEGAAAIEDASVGWVVLNPPFHDRHAVDIDAGRSLVTDAHRILERDGRLIVVSNRHIGHHITIGRVFGERPTVVASNPKFVVLAAVKHASRAAGT